MARDITTSRRLEEELQRASKLESLGVLAGGIAHDFNNLLTGIAGNISVARLCLGEGSGEIKDCLRDIETAAIRASDLTRQLLTFSKGGLPIKKINDLRLIITDAAQLMLRGSQHVPSFNMAEDLWSVECDAGQITQVVGNLVINAAHAMPSGGKIKIRAENVPVDQKDNLHLKDGFYVKVSVIDVGVGIPPENMGKIFDPFFTTKVNGNGLGLSSAYSIIKAHDGCITVNSSIGNGSTFTFYLPAAPGVYLVSQKESENQIVARSRVLVLDDDKVICKMLSILLSSLGHTVTSVNTGEEAIDCFRKAFTRGEKFHGCILDLTIKGGMGGCEVLKQLQTIDPEVRATASSGYSNDPVMANFGSYGFVARLVKPYRFSEVKEMLLTLLQNSPSNIG